MQDNTSLPFLPITVSADELRAVTRRHGHGVLAEGVHFFHAASGCGFHFINAECFNVAIAALRAAGYIGDEFKVDSMASGE